MVDADGPAPDVVPHPAPRDSLATEVVNTKKKKIKKKKRVKKEIHNYFILVAVRVYENSCSNTK